MGRNSMMFCLAAALMIGISASACQLARMSVPPALTSDTVSWPVRGRGGFDFYESFSFGPYTVDQVHRGWTTKFAWGAFHYSSTSAEQDYEFALLKNGSLRYTAQCLSAAKWNQLEFRRFLGLPGTLSWDLDSNESLACLLQPADGQRQLKLGVQQKTQELVFRGFITSGDGQPISVEGSNALAGSSFGLNAASGYVFYCGQKEIAAVEIINDGRFWIKDGQPEEIEEAAAAGSAALLLYRKIKDSGE